MVVNLSVGMVSLLLTLFVLEIVVRSFFQPPSGHSQLFVEYDPLLGWKKIPNVSGLRITPEYSITESINSKGIRGPEYPYDKPNNQYRILILGDSFAEGYMVEFHELFSEVLKANLNTVDNLHLDVEVINSGTGGYSTDQELLWFYTEGKKYNPDLTVLMFYDNDVWFNNQHKYWRGEKPQFVIYDNQFVQLTNVPVPRQEDTPETEFSLGDWLKSDLQLYRFLEARIENTPSLQELGIGLGVIEAPSQREDRPVHIRPEYWVYEKKDGYEIAKAWEITEMLIAKLKEETTSINSEVLIFHIPVRESVYPERWAKMKEQYQMDEDQWSINQARIKLEDICTRTQTDCIQPHQEFRAKAHELSEMEQQLYYAQDGHWNENGMAGCKTKPLSVVVSVPGFSRAFAQRQKPSIQ
jgi:hypothetical protein